MHIEWTPDLSVGIGEIDSQHREFIKRADSFIESVAQGQGTEKLEETVNFFLDYAEKHFLTEEMFMVQFAYPETTPHKKLHNNFREYMDGLKGRIKNNRASITLEDVKEKVAEWFLNHIKNVDARLGAFLKKKMV